MATISEALGVAVGHHQAGRLHEAELIYRQILAAQPDYAHVWYLLGGLAHQAGEEGAAIECLGRAVALLPRFAEGHDALGTVFFDLGRLEEAAACYRRAIEVKPDYADAYRHLGCALRDQGRRGEAVDCFRRAVELNPFDAEAQNSLGAALSGQGMLADAEACYRCAIVLKADYAEAHSNLGNVLSDQGRLSEAVECFRLALELRPDYVVAIFNLGNVHRLQGKEQEAIECFRRAVALKPDFAEAHCNLGNALVDGGQLSEAVGCYQTALKLKPDFAEAYNNLGTVLTDQRLLEQGVDCFEQALRLQPGYAEAHANLGAALKNLARLDESVAHHRRAIELRPDSSRAYSGLLYTLAFCPNMGAADIYEEHRRWARRLADPLAASIRPHGNDRSASRRLRIGYVSPDFRDHCQTFFTVPLFAAHDHQQFEIRCYADAFRPSHVTERLRSYADVRRDITALSDEQAAELIREDEVDVLVDLTMHMERNRLLVFARRPAPVQVTWLAYPGTTGLTAIDYRLTDPFLDPPGLNDEYYSEESVRLAETFWCYDPLTTEPAVSALPAMAQGHVTFGSLNNFCKVNVGVLKLWADVLRSVERSQLVLLAPEGSSRGWILRVFHEEGIESERIVFVGRRPRQQYLELYQQIDIGLDTLPYNGHTTSLDALWMGVPVVTIVGHTVVGRAGLSQLSNLGLTELIAHSADEFVRIATELASDLDRLSMLRGSLRGRMERSPLMDAPRFARNIEAAYRRLWQRWCAAKP